MNKEGIIDSFLDLLGEYFKGTVSELELTVLKEILEYCKNNVLLKELVEVNNEVFSKYQDSLILLYFKGASTIKLKNTETFNVTFREIKSKYPDVFKILESQDIEKFFDKKNSQVHQIIKEGREKIFLEDSRRGEFYFLEANIHFINENYKQMLKALKTTLTLCPDHQEAYKKMLWAVEYTGAYEDSIGFHNALLDKNPFNALAWMNMGYAYTALEKFDSALDAFGFAYAIDELNFDAYMETGEILIRQKHFKRAIFVYKQAFALCGINSIGLHKLGYCFEQLSEFKTACQYYLQAIELNAFDALSFYRMGVCALNEKQFRLAIQFINSAIEIDESDENFYLDLARAYKNNNQLTEALRSYRFATDLAPEIENSWIELIQFLLEANQVRTAESVISEALHNITTPQLEILNFGIQFILKRKKTALKILSKLMSQNNKNLKDVLFNHFPNLSHEEEILRVVSGD